MYGGQRSEGFLVDQICQSRCSSLSDDRFGRKQLCHISVDWLISKEALTNGRHPRSSPFMMNLDAIIKFTDEKEIVWKTYLMSVDNNMIVEVCIFCSCGKFLFRGSPGRRGGAHSMAEDSCTLNNQWWGLIISITGKLTWAFYTKLHPRPATCQWKILD